MTSVLEIARQHKGKIAVGTGIVVLATTEFTGTTHFIKNGMTDPQAPVDQQALMQGAVGTVQAQITIDAPTITPTIPLGSPTLTLTSTLTGGEALATAMNPTTTIIAPSPTASETPIAPPTTTPDASPTHLVNPSVTPGLVGSPSAVPTETAMPSAVYPTLETGGVSPGFDVDGVPSVVYIRANAYHVPNNGPDGDNIDHISEHGPYTGIARPGAYYYDGNKDAAAASDAVNGTNIVRDIDSGTASTMGPDTRSDFNAPNTRVPINEGTFRVVETAGGYLKVEMPDGRVITIYLTPQKNHSWMMIVKGLTQDGSTPDDRNISLLRPTDEGDPFSNSTMTGKGTFMSQEMVNQIAHSMHTAEGAANSSGADGSKQVNIFYLDSNTGSWSVFEVRFDGNGQVAGYKLVDTNSVIQ